MVIGLGQIFPVGQVAVGGNHDGAVAGWGAGDVAGGGDRDEHVITVAEGTVVVEQDLVVGQLLACEFLLRNAEEEDKGTAESGFVALEIGAKVVLDGRWGDFGGVPNGQGGDDLAGLEGGFLGVN